MTLPGGIEAQRLLVAPSDQSGYCGTKDRMPGRTASTDPGSKSPVSLNRSCSGSRTSVANAAPAPKQIAIASKGPLQPIPMGQAFCPP